MGDDDIKKAIALLLVLVWATLLTACGENAEASSQLAESASALASSAVPQSSSAAPSALPPPAAPLTAPAGVNALTGLPVAEGMLENQRPIGIAVTNNPRALPQRGVAAADVLVEMPIEGNETRLLALYADYRAIPPVGPVSASYDQLVQLGLPLDAVQVHIDKSPYARNLLTVLGQKDIDGIQLGKVAFGFDESRQIPRLTGKLNESCWYTDAGLVFNAMSYLDVQLVGSVPSLFQFGAADNYPPMNDAHLIQALYNDVYSAGFRYSGDVNRYFKLYNADAHMDDDGTQLYYDNLLLLSTNIASKSDSAMLEFDLSGGNGWYFTAGGMREIRWQKGEPQQPLRLTDTAGAALLIKPGKTYMGFVSAGRENAVTWQSAEQVAQAVAAAAAGEPPAA